MLVSTDYPTLGAYDGLPRIPASPADLAGITCFQNEKSNYVFGITKSGDEYFIILERNESHGRRDAHKSEVIASEKIKLNASVKLRVEADGDKYAFSYSSNGNDFQNVGGTVSGDILSTDVAGGFTGAMIGLYATSANDALPVK